MSSAAVENKRDQFLEAMRFRHACKTFDTTKKISPEDERFILEAGRLSPSSMGLEPWRFLILDDRALREKMKAVTWGAQGTLPTAALFIVILALSGDRMSAEGEVVDRTIANRGLSGDTADKFRSRVRSYQEKDLRLTNNELVFHWNARQTYIAMANMMTGAAFIGIDSCPIEGFGRDDVESLLASEGVLDRKKYGVACMVAFGYRLNPQPEKKRHPLEEIVMRR